MTPLKVGETGAGVVVVGHCSLIIWDASALYHTPVVRIVPAELCLTNAPVSCASLQTCSVGELLTVLETVELGGIPNEVSVANTSIHSSGGQALVIGSGGTVN